MMYALLKDIPNKAGMVAVDIGANVGVYSVYLSKMGFSVLGMEILPENVKIALGNLKANGLGLDQSVAILQNPVWQTTGIHVETSGASRIGFVQESSTGTMVGVSIADVLTDEDVVPWVKIDIEGVELVARGSLIALLDKGTIVYDFIVEFTPKWWDRSGHMTYDKPAITKIVNSLYEHGFEAYATYSPEISRRQPDPAFEPLPEWFHHA